jgi:hypothetical protein
MSVISGNFIIYFYFQILLRINNRIAIFIKIELPRIPIKVKKERLCCMNNLVILPLFPISLGDFLRNGHTNFCHFIQAGYFYCRFCLLVF